MISKAVRIYNPETGKTLNLGNLITKLGIQAVARKYRVSFSTVEKWRRALHRPARKTLARSLKKLL